MLKESVYRAALNVVTDIKSNNITLSVKPNTPLSQLNATCQDIYGTLVSEDQNNLESYGNVVESITRNGDLISSHSNTMLGLTDQLAKLVQSHLYTVKNVVLPIINDLSTAIETRVNNMPDFSATSSFNINILSLPALLSEPEFLELIEPYKDNALIITTDKLNLPIKDMDAIKEYMSLGNLTLNAALESFFANLGAEKISKIWKVLFTTTDIAPADLIPSLNAFDRINYGLVGFLCSSYLFNTPDKDLTNIDLKTYNTLLADRRKYCGALISSSLNLLQSLIKSNTILLKYNTDKSIDVNGPVYNRWLSAGNKPETLLGLIVSGDIASTVYQIDKNKDKYNTRWEQYVAFYETKAINDKLKYFKTIVKEEVFSLKPLEIELQNPNPDLNNYIENTINNANVADMTNPYYLCLCLVACGKFHFTAAHQILCYMDDISKSLEIKDPREIATLAAANYLTDWLLTSLNVVTVDGEKLY